MNRKVIGSLTAKEGFKNEKEIANKFNNWKEDKTAQHWLKIMGYNLKLLESVKAIQIPLRIKKNDAFLYHLDLKENYIEMLKHKKSDVQICLIIKLGKITKIENISIKKANINADYNQVDKRTIDSYKEMWGFNDDIATYLKLFTGELKAKDFPNIIKLKECIIPEKRVYLNEFNADIQNKIKIFFEANKLLVVSDILHGRGALSADWMLVTKNDNDNVEWILVDINVAMNHFASGNVIISQRGNLHIGKITMQRKGGTPDPTKLQFKIHPCSLFDI